MAFYPRPSHSFYVLWVAWATYINLYIKIWNLGQKIRNWRNFLQTMPYPGLNECNHYDRFQAIKRGLRIGPHLAWKKPRRRAMTKSLLDRSTRRLCSTTTSTTPIHAQRDPPSNHWILRRQPLSILLSTTPATVSNQLLPPQELNRTLRANLNLCYDVCLTYARRKAAMTLHPYMDDSKDSSHADETMKHSSNSSWQY